MKPQIKLDSSKNTLQILFAFEAIESRPNLDPYGAGLRRDEDTGQVLTSDVHLKHHIRRGLKPAAEEAGLGSPEVFYEKKGADGSSRSLVSRVEDLGVKTAEEILKSCVDLPLFGFVYAKPSGSKKVPGESFQKNGACNTLLAPRTFHRAKILYIGKNNAFSQKNDAGEDKVSSGSAISDVLEYGMFLSLLEVNIPALKENIKGHKLGEDPAKWVELLLSGIWKAYSSHRMSSNTQRGQFASFLLAWHPDKAEEITPTTLKQVCYSEGLVTNVVEARKALKGILPGFLGDWQFSSETELYRHDPRGILSDDAK
jgi:Cas7 group CRISPR-associated protein Csh2